MKIPVAANAVPQALIAYRFDRERKRHKIVVSVPQPASEQLSEKELDKFRAAVPNYDVWRSHEKDGLTVHFEGPVNGRFSSSWLKKCARVLRDFLHAYGIDVIIGDATPIKNSWR